MYALTAPWNPDCVADRSSIHILESVFKLQNESEKGSANSDFLFGDALPRISTWCYYRLRASTGDKQPAKVRLYDICTVCRTSYCLLVVLNMMVAPSRIQSTVCRIEIPIVSQHHVAIGTTSHCGLRRSSCRSVHEVVTAAQRLRHADTFRGELYGNCSWAITFTKRRAEVWMHIQELNKYPHNAEKRSAITLVRTPFGWSESSFYLRLHSFHSNTSKPHDIFLAQIYISAVGNSTRSCTTAWVTISWGALCVCLVYTCVSRRLYPKILYTLSLYWLDLLRWYRESELGGDTISL